MAMWTQSKFWNLSWRPLGDRSVPLLVWEPHAFTCYFISIVAVTVDGHSASMATCLCCAIGSAAKRWPFGLPAARSLDVHSVLHLGEKGFCCFYWEHGWGEDGVCGQCTLTDFMGIPSSYGATGVLPDLGCSMPWLPTLVTWQG